MSSYQTGPFDEPRPIPQAEHRTSVSGASGHRGSFGGPSPQQQQQAAEQGYFGPHGALPTGPPAPNSYGPPSPRYPTKAQKEYEAQRYPSPPMSPMTIPQAQQQYATPVQGYETSQRRQSTPNGSSATYAPVPQPQQTTPHQRRSSQPYIPGQYNPPQYDRRPSLPAAPSQQYQPLPDQLHPAHAYGMPQQNAAPMNGHRSPQAAGSPRQSRSSDGDDEAYDRRQANGDRRRSDGLTRPQMDYDRRRVSDHGPRRSDYEEDDYSRRRRRSRDDRDDSRRDDYANDVERERRRSRANSTGGNGKAKSKKEIEKLKKEAYGRPSYGDSLGWASKNMRKFFSSDRS